MDMRVFWDKISVTSFSQPHHCQKISQLQAQVNKECWLCVFSPVFGIFQLNIQEALSDPAYLSSLLRHIAVCHNICGRNKGMNERLSLSHQTCLLQPHGKPYCDPKNKNTEFCYFCLLFLMCSIPWTCTTEILLFRHGLIINTMCFQKSSQMSALIKNSFSLDHPITSSLLPKE